MWEQWCLGMGKEVAIWEQREEQPLSVGRSQGTIPSVWNLCSMEEEAATPGRTSDPHADRHRAERT